MAMRLQWSLFRIRMSVGLLSVDDVTPLLVYAGSSPIRVEQPWWGHCGVEQSGDEVPGLLVVRRWVQKPTDNLGMEILLGPPARGDDIEGVHSLAFIGDGVAEVGEGIKEVH